jgi:hypothetical protein
VYEDSNFCKRIQNPDFGVDGKDTKDQACKIVGDPGKVCKVIAQGETGQCVDELDFDLYKTGKQFILYYFEDDSGNLGNVVRTLDIRDAIPPTIKLFADQRAKLDVMCVEWRMLASAVCSLLVMKVDSEQNAGLEQDVGLEQDATRLLHILKSGYPKPRLVADIVTPLRNGIASLCRYEDFINCRKVKGGCTTELTDIYNPKTKHAIMLRNLQSPLGYMKSDILEGAQPILHQNCVLLGCLVAWQKFNASVVPSFRLCHRTTITGTVCRCSPDVEFEKTANVAINPEARRLAQSCPTEIRSKTTDLTQVFYNTGKAGCTNKNNQCYESREECEKITTPAGVKYIDPGATAEEAVGPYGTRFLTD